MIFYGRTGVSSQVKSNIIAANSEFVKLCLIILLAILIHFQQKFWLKRIFFVDKSMSHIWNLIIMLCDCNFLFIFLKSFWEACYRKNFHVHNSWEISLAFFEKIIFSSDAIKIVKLLKTAAGNNDHTCCIQKITFELLRFPVWLSNRAFCCLYLLVVTAEVSSTYNV